MTNTLYLKNSEFLPHVIELANAGHEVKIPLRGVSMRPFLEDHRDNAVMIRIARELKVGDVVLAETLPGTYVLHRIISINGDRVVTLGDGNLLIDRPMTRSDVKLLVKGFYRKGSDKFDSVDSLYFRTYSWCWMKLRPLRRYLLAVWRRLPKWMRNLM